MMEFHGDGRRAPAACRVAVLAIDYEALAADENADVLSERVLQKVWNAAVARIARITSGVAASFPLEVLRHWQIRGVRNGRAVRSRFQFIVGIGCAYGLGLQQCRDNAED